MKRRRPDLSTLFDQHLNLLDKRLCPASILNSLSAQKDQVLSRSVRSVGSKSRFPFLPVISETRLHIYDQVTLMRNGELVGFTYYGTHSFPNECENIVAVPDASCYFIFDVEIEIGKRSWSPAYAERIVRRRKRTGLTSAEIIALALHSSLLQEGGICAVGSYCGQDRVPWLYLDDDNRRPWFGWHYRGSSYGGEINPSCSERTSFL